MRLVVAAVGRLKTGPERELVERYRERAASVGRGLGFRGVDVIEVDEDQGRRPAERITAETKALEKVVADGAPLVVLDSRGKSLSSEVFARQLGQWRQDGRNAVFFVIGGADGMADGFLRSASLRLSFGAQTWPHQLVRIMLLEQIYRAVTILAGHPYHRA